MHIHIDQGVSFTEQTCKKNIKIQKLGKLLLAHFGCILAHCAADRFCQKYTFVMIILIAKTSCGHILVSRCLG